MFTNNFHTLLLLKKTPDQQSLPRHKLIHTVCKPVCLFFLIIHLLFAATL